MDCFAHVSAVLKLLDITISTLLICAEYPTVPECDETDTQVQDSASHTASNVLSYYGSQPANSFDFSASVSHPAMPLVE